MLTQDNYYLPREEQPIDQNGHQNFDLPQSIDHAAFKSDFENLLNRKEVKRTEYVYNNPNATPRELVTSPSDLIIIEGIFAFHEPSVFSKIDLKVFVNTSSYLMLKRRLIRDEHRGYGAEDVLYRFENHVMPSFRKYIKVYREKCDIIVPNKDKIETAVEVLSNQVKMKLFK